MTKTRFLAATALAIAAALPQIAYADVAFTQSNPNDFGIRWTRSGSSASISDVATSGYSDLLVNLTLHDGSIVSALFSLTGSTTEAATQSMAGIYEQSGISGGFSFTNATTGEDYLTGTYADASITGSGTSGSFFSTVNSNVTYTSGSEAALQDGGFSIALNNTNHAIAAGAGRPLNSFNARVSGTFNAQAVPELSTWTMLIVGFAGLGAQARRRGFKLPARMPALGAA